MRTLNIEKFLFSLTSNSFKILSKECFQYMITFIFKYNDRNGISLGIPFSQVYTDLY